MKLTLLAAAMTVLSAITANATTYDCKANGQGKITVDALTLSTTSGAAFVYPVGVKVNAIAGQSTFSQVVGNVNELGLPVVLQDSKGGTLLSPSTRNDVLFAPGYKRSHEVMYAYMSWGISNDKNTGYVVFMYKQTDGDDSSNLGQWSRQYACTAR